MKCIIKECKLAATNGAFCADHVPKNPFSLRNVPGGGSTSGGGTGAGWDRTNMRDESSRPTSDRDGTSQE
jgi:hypothetical protein